MICAIFNTFGKGNTERVSRYFEAIDSLLDQRGVDMDIVISMCAPGDGAKNMLYDRYKGRVIFNIIPQVVPLGVSFNCTVNAVKDDKYDAYLYIDSGMSLKYKTDGVARLYKTHKSGQFGMTSAKASNDTGTVQWKILEGRGLTILKPPRAINMHFQLFDKSLLDFYGRLLPDIFANDCSESTFSFMCAAIGKNFVLDHDIVIDHYHSMDGASAGSRKGFFFQKPGSVKEDFTPIYLAGKKYGMGFEGCDPQKRWLPDMDKFDENGFSKDPELKHFIKENLFADFDYTTLANQLIKKGVCFETGHEFKAYDIEGNIRKFYI